MALKVAIEGNTGAVADYWRVVEVNLNWFSASGQITIVGYLKKEARQAGKRPLDARQFPIEGPAFAAFAPEVLDEQGANPLASAYRHVKAQDEFKDAKDDV